MKNLTVIANPRAGRGRADSFLGPFVRRAEAMGQRIDLAVTQRPGHAVELARSAAANADAVCVVGGDGTVHEVANGLLLLPDPTPMVVIPCGSGDDFARLVGCPRDADELFTVVDDGVGVELDVLDCGERFCVNSCGLGFEALVTKNSRSIQRLKGLPLYLLALAKAMAEFSCPDLEITLDNGDVISGQRLLVSVGNGVSAGGGFFLTPDALPDDGLIDLCIVEKMGRMKMMGLLPLSLKGTHTTRSEVEMRRTRRLTVKSSTPLHVHVDGEYLGDDRRSISFELLDRRLPVLCKKDSPGRYSQTPRKLI